MRWGCGQLATQRLHTVSEGERSGSCSQDSSCPELMLFDEPAAGLDYEAREQLLGHA